MRAPKDGYPHSIVDSDGNWGVILKGHGIDEAVVAAAIIPICGEPRPDERLEISEELFVYTNRVKWCERLIGWPCDNEGEWHSHWYAVNTDDPTYHFTTAYYVPTEEGDKR